MGIRAIVDERRWLIGASALVLVVLLVVLILPRKQTAPMGIVGNRAWYTDDDGKTYFLEEGRQGVALQRNGKEAVECVVYRCGVNSPPFVNHLVRYDPKSGLRQVKRPGSQGWLDVNDRAAMAVMKPNPPNGSIMDLMPVDPNQ